jgi:hypothetical protein
MFDPHMTSELAIVVGGPHCAIEVRTDIQNRRVREVRMAEDQDVR